jgi:hypothetical protein
VLRKHLGVWYELKYDENGNHYLVATRLKRRYEKLLNCMKNASEMKQRSMRYRYQVQQDVAWTNGQRMSLDI